MPQPDPYEHPTRDSDQTCDVCRFTRSAVDNQDLAGMLSTFASRYLRLLAPFQRLRSTRPKTADQAHRLLARSIAANVTDLASITRAVIDKKSLSSNPATDVIKPSDSWLQPASANSANTDQGLSDLLMHFARLGSELAEVAVSQPTAREHLLAAVHKCYHDLIVARNDLSEAGLLARPEGFKKGAVVAINVSQGGAPKSPIPNVHVGYRGLSGDIQANRKHHGRICQAVCLYSAELIDALRTEGHPIVPGGVGENLLVSGLNWAALQVGHRIQIGTVSLEVTNWVDPCQKIAANFLDRRFDRIHPEKHPGWARAYARVVTDGEIKVSDSFTIEV